MALSGSFDLTTTSGSTYVKGTITWSATQSATGNYSDVTTVLTMRRTNSGYTTYGTGSFTIETNGTSKSSGSGTYSITQTNWTFNGTSGYTLSQTVRINHNTDGTKSFTIKGSFTGDTPMGGSGSKSFTLNTIDRNPPTVKGSVAYQGGGVITLTATSSVTANKWEYKIGSGAWTQYSTASATSRTTSNLTPGTGSYTTYVRATKASNGVIGTSSAFTVDLTAPTVTLALSNITTNSIKLTATATYSCDYWEYRYKVGSGSYSAWDDFSSASGTSKTYTKSGLSPNQSYTFQVRAKRASNQVKGTSSAKSATTIGASVLTSVPALQIDNTTTIALGITVYSTSFYHKLTIKDGGTTVGSVNIGKISSTGSVTQNVNLSSLKTAILNTMTSSTSKSLTFLLGTYSDSGYTSQIGSDSSKAGTVKVSSTYSAPTFTGGLTCEDTNASIIALTGGDAYVQGLSTLKVSFSSATAKNQASISSYTTTVGAKSKTGSSPVSFGVIDTSGSSTGVTVTAKDSRGFTKTQSETIPVLEYYPPEISQLTIARVNNYEDVAVLNIDGSYSPVEFNGSPLNSIPSDQITYRMKEVGGSWGAYQTITLTVDPSDQTFTYSSNTFESGNLDRTKEYQFEFVITDALGGSLTVTRNLPDGTPVMSLRKGKVGINEPDPRYPLDVGGDAYVDGELHGVKVYTKSPDNNNSPSVFFMDSDADYLGRIYYTRDSASSPRRIIFQAQKNNGTNTEAYRLPTPDVGTATSETYDIVTTKDFDPSAVTGETERFVHFYMASDSTKAITIPNNAKFLLFGVGGGGGKAMLLVNSTSTGGVTVGDVYKGSSVTYVTATNKLTLSVASVFMYWIIYNINGSTTA